MDGSIKDFNYRIAREDFENALRKGFWRSVRSWFKKTNNTLLQFDEVRKYLPTQGQHDIGIHQIEVEKIVGSVGRYNDFDKAFLPRHRATRGRWISIDMANLQDVSLPPIEVYKLGDVYFVKDGNHRVSVAREKGQIYIDANVTEVATHVKIDANTNVDALILEQDKASFYHHTDIKELVQNVEINLTLPGQYQKLIEHIDVHRWYLGEKLGREIPYSEAVLSWYRQVYLELINVIREQRILREFPDRTEGDLYLWIIEHLYFMRQEYNHEISLYDAVYHFTSQFSKHPTRKLKNWLRRLVFRIFKSFEDASDLELRAYPDQMDDKANLK